MIALELTTATAVAFALAVLFYPALRWNWRARVAALAVLCPSILMCPMLVAPGHRFARFLAAVLAVALVVKLYDLHLGVGRGHRPNLGAFLAFLPNLCSVVLRRLDQEPQPGRRENLARLAWSGLLAVAGVMLLIGVFGIEWTSQPFVVEHCTKVLAFFLALVPAASAGASAWRCVGGRAREPMDNPFVARTPADFWRRYNRPAQQFFHEDIFRPAGGVRSPIRATLLTFAVSAALHEYLFTIAVGRVLGYQTAFFLIHGLAVAATLRVEPRGWRAAPWVVGTLAFNLGAGLLFFASLDQVVPFYARRVACGAFDLCPP